MARRILATAALVGWTSLASFGCCCVGEHCVNGSCAMKKQGPQARVQFAEAERDAEAEYEGVQASYEEPVAPKKTACHDGACRH